MARPHGRRGWRWPPDKLRGKHSSRCDRLGTVSPPRRAAARRSRPSAPLRSTIRTAEISTSSPPISLPRETAGGRLATGCPGLYKTRIRIGRRVTSRVLALDGATVQSARPPGIEDALAPASAGAPPRAAAEDRLVRAFHNAFATRKDQVDSARHSAERPAGTSDLVRGRGAELMIMRLQLEQRPAPRRRPSPWQGVRLVDARAGSSPTSRPMAGASEQGDPFATCLVSVAPGTYFLRHALADQRFEQALVVPGGWRLARTYLLRRMADRHGRRAAAPPS